MNILIVYDSNLTGRYSSLYNLSQVKAEFIKKIKKDNFTLKKQDFDIIVEDTKYHFFDNDKRRLDVLIKKNIVFDYIYINYHSDISFFKDLVDDVNNIIIQPSSLSSDDLCKHYQSKYDEIEVFKLSWDDKTIGKTTIRTYQFKEKVHFRTRTEAKAHMKILAEQRVDELKKQIKSYEQRLKQEENFLSKL